MVRYADTGYFYKSVTDYIERAPQLKPFFAFEPALDSVPEIIKKRKQFALHREVLSNALLKQLDAADAGGAREAVRNQVLQLSLPETFTVVTAHQPNLFLGPLYLIYKIVSAIKLARKFSQHYPEYHFVPVYWMGSEDHDKVELNNIHLFGKTFTWQTEQQGAFGRMNTATLAPLIEDISRVLGTSEDALQCSRLLEACYLNEPTIAAATKKILYHFFGQDGLVIADGDDPALKMLFMPVMERELLEQFSFPLVEKSTTEFEKHYHSQITPREINLFYLDDGLRSRIVKDGADWRVLNTPLKFNREQLITLMQTQPGRFSPNVVLRPLYQELVLPNIAFIGGGAEVTYWMQLKDVFFSAGVAFPMLLLRNSALWIDQVQATRMNKLNLAPAALFKPADVLIRSFLERQSGNAFSLDTERVQLSELMDHVSEHAMHLDAGMKAAVEAEKVKMLKSLDALEEKLRKVVKKREEVSLQQLQGLKDKLFPDHSLQERHDNFLPFYLKYGHSFVEALREHFDPLEMQFTVLVEAP